MIWVNANDITGFAVCSALLGWVWVSIGHKINISHQSDAGF